MRSVLATSHTPGLESGRARRTYGLTRALAALGPVDLVYGAFGAPEPDPAYAEIDGLTLHRVERPGTLERLPAYLRARSRRVPDDFARGVWPGVGRRAAELLAADPAARPIADGPVAATALLAIARRRPAVYSAHNLESAFRHRLGEAGASAAALERFERLLLGAFAETWMVSEADVVGARELDPSADVRLVPNVVDVAATRPLAPRSGQRAVAFVADFGYEPNRQALRFLAAEAMPRLWEQAADVRLLVAGKGGAEVLGEADPRIEARGFVDDLRRHYDEAGVVAVPLLEGGGSPLKFVEALAYQVPVVATARAAAGLAVDDGEHFLAAPDTGEGFAAALLAALDPARGNQLAAAGRQLAEQEYSIESLTRRLAG
jgi:glycosyltransferase involved in cell wall biosynthesis